MCDYTARLPPELRRMICELASHSHEVTSPRRLDDYRDIATTANNVSQVPQTLLKTVRLVNQSWSHVAAALLWHTFTANLGDTSTRELDALLTSRPGGFLDSVRILNIGIANDLQLHESQARLLQLLSLLPRGILLKFTAEHAIDRRTLGILIRKHPRLRDLSLLLQDDIKAKGPPDGRYVAGNLTHMRVLTIRADEDQGAYDAWFAHTPNLESLTVSGIRIDAMSGFKPWYAEPKSKLGKLRSLYLANLNLLPSAGDLDMWLDLDRLENITIRNCESAENFLDDLAEAYSSHGLSALKSLTIYAESVECDWIEELETFLAAVRGLDYLYVSTTASQRLNPQSICHQASSLRYFVVEYLNSWDQEEDDVDCIYNAKELEYLSKACSNIEELGISCPQINFVEWPPLEPFAWSSAAMRSLKEKQLTQFLDVIVKFPKLRVLRMTQSALDVMDDGSNDPFLERQWRYQQYAEQLLTYLVERDSSVELLAFSPTRVSRNFTSSIPDANDHKWPHYYYVRAESETVLPRGHSKKQVVAVPVKPSEISNYMEEPRILVDPEKV